MNPIFTPTREVSTFSKFPPKRATPDARNYPSLDRGPAEAWVLGGKPSSAPAFDRKIVAGCKCESSPECMQVYYAARHNENLELATTDDVGNSTAGGTWREVPEWVQLKAEAVEASCEATIHYPRVTLDEWIGYDVLTLDDVDKRERLAEEDEALMIAHSTVNAAQPRWEAEHQSYADQHEFIEQLTTEKRNLLVRLIRACGGDPALPATIAWVQGAVEAKHGNRLRGYSRCIWQLQRRIESGEVAVNV